MAKTLMKVGQMRGDGSSLGAELQHIASPDISPELRTVPILSCNSRRLGASGA